MSILYVTFVNKAQALTLVALSVLYVKQDVMLGADYLKRLANKALSL